MVWEQKSPTPQSRRDVICHFRTTANRQTNRQETEIKNVTLRP